MALSYTIDRSRCRVTVVVTAQPSLEQFVQVMTRLLADPAFERGDDILWNRQGSRALPTQGYVEVTVHWVHYHQPALGHGRVAFVAPEGVPAVYGMARMLELLSEQLIQLRVFTVLDEAVRWLDERFTT